MSKWADCSIQQLLERIAELETNEAEYEHLLGRRTYREIAVDLSGMGNYVDEYGSTVIHDGRPIDESEAP
jgi:hypothetical protein